MARRLDSFPEASSGRKARYPWDEWLDGSTWELKLVDDTHAKTLNGFRSFLTSTAAKRGLKVHTAKIDEDTLVIQAYTPHGQG